MMFLTVSALVCAATVAFVSALQLRRRVGAGGLLRERVGVSRGEEWAPLQIERDERLSAFPSLDRLLRTLAVARQLELLLYQAGVDMRMDAFLLGVGVCAMAGYIVGVSVFHHVLHGLVLLAALAAAPFILVEYKKSERQRAFAEELPNTLDLLVSALRAGISFGSALQIVADESPEPIRSEFAIVVEEQALGLDLPEALTKMANRVGSLDLKFFVTAVVLQRSAGGSLAEVLENTSRLIRDRFRILREIKTFTAQGRLTGVILSALPLTIGIFMLLVAPDYSHKMWLHPTGRAVLGFAFLMQLLGWLAIRKIVDIKV